ncbi:YetF domain-containing protein [Rossellomorea vietnamensis]|uniref:YetF domain-containing protein n=1 Tax=Rossellomorea vietnamensis TaxID=218284 RepID=UPI003CE87995
MNIFELFLRVVIAFIALFIMARLSGRKEISQMTFFNFISAVAVGNIGGTIVVSAELSIRNGLLALAGWLILTVGFSYIDLKSKGARKILEGEPIIVVKQGKIMEHSLKKTQLDVDGLMALLREKQVFSMKDVDYAIFETNGKLSVLKKQAQQTITKNDMNVPLKSEKYPQSTEVIADGEVIQNNLKRLNLQEEWLILQLQQKGIQSISEVFYAEVQKDGSLYIDKKKDNMTR